MKKSTPRSSRARACSWKTAEDLLGLGMARLNADAERADGAGDEDFARGGFARFAGDLHAAAVQALHFVAEAERGELEAVRAERIGFDDLRARFDVGLVNAEDGFGFRGVEFIEAATVPTASCNIEPIAPSAMRMESFSRSLKS